MFVIVVHAGGAFYACQGSLGESTPHDRYAARLVGTSPVAVKSPVRVVAVAQDADGRWWSAFRGGRRISAPIGEWLDSKRSSYGFDCPPIEINS